MKPDLKKYSKFLSLILRHEPEAIGVQLDDGGWLEIDTFISAAKKKGMNYTVELIREIVFSNDKQRFALSEDGIRIRANQGHSIPIELGLVPLVPPTELYHGTADRFLDSIRHEGLKRMSRQHVHLSEKIETARNVGQRHGRPAVLVVQALSMHQAGYKFYQSENGVWLTDHVPASFLIEGTALR